MIGMDGMMTRALLRYTQGYLPPGICSLIKPAAVATWFHFPPKSSHSCYDMALIWFSRHPYPEPVYTGWSSVHCNATGMPLVDPVYTGMPLEKLSWNSPTLECHWRNLVESAPHWDATGETLTFAAYTGTPLEGLRQPTHALTHIVKHAE